jgi:AraC-like DNA-binding protein
MHTQIEIIHQAIEFIESQLQSRGTIAQIAEHAGYSLFYFIRTFNKITHQTPYDYLITRRLGEALKMLGETDRRITDIALDFCFETPESFSRAFKRLFGVLPSLCRKESLPESVFPVSPKTLQDLQFINRSGFISPAVIECEGKIICGLPAEFDVDDAVGYLEHEKQLRTRMASYLKAGIITVRSYSDSRCSMAIRSAALRWRRERESSPPLTVQRNSLRAVCQNTLPKLTGGQPCAICCIPGCRRRDYKLRHRFYG